MSNMREKMKDVLLVLSWREIAHHYFNKSSSWLYHKLDGINGNGGKDDFNDEEKEQLKNALLDLSERIHKTAMSI